MGLAPSKSSAGGGGGGGGGGRTTVSSMVNEAETISFVMRFAGYSQTKGLFGVGSSINSSTFDVGGHSWHIAFFPEGSRQEYADWVSIILCLDRRAAAGDVVRAAVQFTLLDGDNGRPVLKSGRSTTALPFSFADGYSRSWGCEKFVPRKQLEDRFWSWLRLEGAGLYIRCELTVLSTDRRKASLSTPVVVPPSDLHRHLGDILGTGVRADMLFLVAGQEFPAHRSVVAARSSMLKVMLLGLGAGMETPEVCVRVNDIDADVFRAMLHFIYTDTLPDIHEGRRTWMAQELLIAAHRFNIQRLKFVSEDMLHRGLDEKNVATTLWLAEKYGCLGLKKACLVFIRSTPLQLLGDA